MKQQYRIRALLALLVLAALLLTACGTPAAPEVPETTEAPAEPEVTETPEESPAPESSPLPEGAVEVGTVDELLAALAPNAVIVLRAGDYQLDRASDYGREDLKGSYCWELVAGGCQLVIKDLSGLRLIGQGEVNILAQPRYAEVIRFTDCYDLSLEGLTLGHTQEPGACAAGVLSFFNCEEISLKDCRLFGCGSMGISANGCKAFRAQNCRIDSCSYGAIQASTCRDLRFEDCELVDCGLSDNGPGFDLVSAERCRGFALVNCKLSGNRMQQLLRSFWSDQVVMLGCRVEQNRIFGSMFQFTGRGATVDKCSFQHRSSESYYPAGEIVFAKNPAGEDLLSFDLDRMELARAEYDGPAPAEETTLDRTEQPDGTFLVKVQTVDELLAAIAPNTTILLSSGTYDLSASENYGGADGEWYTWEEVYDGYSLLIQGVDGLRIVGQDRENTRILVQPRYAAVFRFENCRDLALSGFVAGHTEGPGYCTGNVLDFFWCEQLSVTDCGLFGCGVVGVYAVDCSGLTLDSTEIYECSDAAAILSGCTDVCFQGCSIHDCDDARNYIFLYGGVMSWDEQNLSEGVHSFDWGAYLGETTPAW